MNKKQAIPIVGIAGCSAVGKSTFTRKLNYVLRKDGIRVITLNLDDFQPQLLTVTERLQTDFLHDVMREILSGKEHIVRPVWDKTWSKQTKENITTCLHDIDLILIEGLYTLCGAETPYDILKYCSCRVFLDASDDLIRSWNWERELKSEGRDLRTKEKFDADVDWDMQDYRRFILPCKEIADFIIVKDEKHRMTVFVQRVDKNRSEI